MTWEVIQGDCLEVMRGMKSASFDFVFADPPYNVGIDYGGYDDNKTSDAYMQWCVKWFRECKRISRNSIVVTPGMVSVPMWLADIERTHFIIAWTKQNNCSRNYIGKTSGFQTWEPVLVFGKSKKTILRDSVEIPISKQRGIGAHPCPKPLRLLEWLLPQFADNEDVVLDPFCGSGTTGVACVKTGRNFVGIEINPQYCEIARNRIKQAEKEMVLLL